MIFHQAFNSLSNYNYNISLYTDKIWDFHFHKNLELIYCISGEVNCTINNIPYRMTAGDYGLCLPYDIHRYDPIPDKGTLYWVLVFSEDFVRFFSSQIVGKSGDGFIFRLKEPTANYINARLIQNEAPSIYTLKSCLYAICEEYLNSVKLLDKDRTEAEIIPLIADFIFENHTSRITLSDIAEKLGYDYNYMSRYFRNVFNMTFTDFLNIYRLETALKLLEDTNESITSIAYESGFQSVRSFNSFFKTHMDTTPSEYRKTFRN